MLHSHFVNSHQASHVDASYGAKAMWNTRLFDESEHTKKKSNEKNEFEGVLEVSVGAVKNDGGEPLLDGAPHFEKEASASRECSDSSAARSS